MRKAVLAGLLALVLVLASCSKTVAPSKRSVDYDITALSSTVAYSQVVNMLSNPSPYIGKVVRVSGPFNVLVDTDQNTYFPAVMVTDSTACCSLGMEFVLSGEPSYPEGYPAIYQEVTVEGIFDTYTDGGVQYCHLVQASILK